MNVALQVAERMSGRISEKLLRMRRRRLTRALLAKARLGAPRAWPRGGLDFPPPCAGAGPVDGRVTLLGVTFDLRAKDLWTASPDAAEPWPAYYHSDINLRHPGFGDTKLIWELGRLQFLPHLLATDPILGEHVLRRFLDEVTPLWSIHWVSEMEIGIRMISLIRCAAMLHGALRERTIEAINVHYHYLRDHLTTHWRVRNNHILVETSALIVYEQLFEVPGRDERLAEHWQLLREEIAAQIFDDGGLREQTVAYARFNLEAFLTVALACVWSGGAVPGRLAETIERMLDWLAAVRLPEGRWPMIGDADDGHVGCFAPAADGWDFRYLFDLAERLGMALPPSPGDGARLLAESGYWVWREGGDQLILRAGLFGLGGDGGAPHSHCDEQSVIVSFGGRAVLVDCGTFSYEDRRTDSPRVAMKSCAAHNGVAVDGLDQAEPRGNFSWGRTPSCRIVRADGRGAVAEFADDTGELYVWRREVRCERGRVELRDAIEFKDAGEHELAWHFNLAVGLSVAIDGARALVRDADGPVAEIVADGRIDLVATEGLYSESYNTGQTITRLVGRMRQAGLAKLTWQIRSRS